MKMKLTAKNVGLIAAIIFMTAFFGRVFNGHAFSAHCIKAVGHTKQAGSNLNGIATGHYKK